jgi:hypothetical protein
VIKGITFNAGWQNFYILPPLVFILIMLPCALIIALTEWQAIIPLVMFPIILAIIYADTSEKLGTILRNAINDAFYDAKL